MIIALGHEKNVGKDTFAMFITEYLREKFKNLHVVKEGFADRLYNFCQDVYGWAGFQSRIYYNNNPKMKDISLERLPEKWTPRKILLNVAEKIREFDPKIFMSPVYFGTPCDVKFIPDMRTPPEFFYALEHPDKIYTVRITANYIGYKPIDYGKDDIDGYLLPYKDKWRETINNNNLAQFREAARDFADRIIIPKLQEKLRNGPR